MEAKMAVFQLQYRRAMLVASGVRTPLERAELLGIDERIIQLEGRLRAARRRPA